MPGDSGRIRRNAHGDPNPLSPASWSDTRTTDLDRFLGTEFVEVSPLPPLCGGRNARHPSQASIRPWGLPSKLAIFLTRLAQRRRSGFTESLCFVTHLVQAFCVRGAVSLSTQPRVAGRFVDILSFEVGQPCLNIPPGTITRTQSSSRLCGIPSRPHSASSCARRAWVEPISASVTTIRYVFCAARITRSSSG